VNWLANLAVGEQCLSEPTISGDGNINLSTDEGRVYAFTPKGKPLCAPYDNGGTAFASAPAIEVEGNLYVLAADGHVISLTKKLGLRWSYDLGAPAVASSLAIGNDGTLYIGGTNKLVGLK